MNIWERCSHFLPTSPTDQDQHLVTNFNFGVFHLILMKFDLGANYGRKMMQIEFEKVTTIFRTTSPINQIPFFWKIS